MLVCLDQEATVRKRHGTMNWFKLGKDYIKVVYCHFCLFNNYAEYIIRNVRLDESQAGIKIARRNSNNFRYADDTTLKAESKEGLSISWWEWKTGLKLRIQKVKIMESGPITSLLIYRGKVEEVTNLIFLGSKITADGDCSHEIKRHLLLWRESYDKSK